MVKDDFRCYRCFRHQPISLVIPDRAWEQPGVNPLIADRSRPQLKAA